MAQKQYTEKPVKVLAEQYHAGSVPPAVGVCTCTLTPVYPDGRVHVHTETGLREPHEGDLLVASKFRPDVILEVLPLAEFEERFGNVPGEEIIT